MIPMCHNAVRPPPPPYKNTSSCARLTPHAVNLALQEIAKKVVSQSKYAPQGTRGCGSPFTHYVFGVEEGVYEATCNDNLLTIVQIESQEGLDNVEAIAAVEGVGSSSAVAFDLYASMIVNRASGGVVWGLTDSLFVGPFDLAKSMDVEFGGDAHQAAVARILKATKAAGKVASIFCASSFTVSFPHALSR